MRLLTAMFALMAVSMEAQPRLVTLPSQSPMVSLRLVFLTGAACDPAGKEGLAALTAAMLAQGGSRRMTYQEILDALFPMAVSVRAQVDKEMTTFSAETHADNLDAFYQILRGMLLEPGWREEDLRRLRDDAVNFLRVSLRSNNDEELGKEVLYTQLYAGHPYGHHNVGRVSSLEKLTVEDLRGFYARYYRQSNLIIGLAGGYPKDFPERVRKDFSRLPAGRPAFPKLPEPPAIRGLKVTMIEKDTRSVAYSIGFPIGVRRGDPDYPALLVAQSYFGQHRMSGGRLYERIRQLRGLNYGDYAYIEYFPRGMFQFEPDPNLGRQQQIFQIWIRPVEPATAHFTLRLAMYELERLVRDGITKEQFERTRLFLSKYVNLLTRSKSAELGYAIDSLYYGIPDYNSYLKAALAQISHGDVNRVIRRHLRPTDLHIVVVGKNCEQLRQKLLADQPSPMTYNAPKPPEILEEDKIVERWKLGLKPEDIRIIPVEKIFE